MRYTAWMLLAAGAIAAAQTPPVSLQAPAQPQAPFQPQPQAPKPSDAEQQDLMTAVNSSTNSPVDLLRSLEAYLQKYPNTVQRPEIEQTLAKAAIDMRDNPKIVLYGERVLSRTPDDVLMLDRVSQALLALGGPDNAKKSLSYARKLEDIVEAMPPPTGSDAAQRQEDRDRARARMLIVQARARGVLGEQLEAEQLAGRAYEAYPAEETAREWAETLLRLGREQ
ncbi:MAG TPA: hypothetical protein VFA04_20755, partial [Bryobacteraceae bacterium]|nr:hypothetical protein [Bryobacteraceae bacterium]